MHLVEESGIDESDKNNVASRGKMLLHVVKSLEYWSLTIFSAFSYRVGPSVAPCCTASSPRRDQAGYGSGVL